MRKVGHVLILRACSKFERYFKDWHLHVWVMNHQFKCSWTRMWLEFTTLSVANSILVELRFLQTHVACSVHVNLCSVSWWAFLAITAPRCRFIDVSWPIFLWDQVLRTLCDLIVTAITSHHEIHLRSVHRKRNFDKYCQIWRTYRQIALVLRIKHEIFIVFLTDNDELQSPGGNVDTHPRFSAVAVIHFLVPLQEVQRSDQSKRWLQM